MFHRAEIVHISISLNDGVDFYPSSNTPEHSKIQYLYYRSPDLSGLWPRAVDSHSRHLIWLTGERLVDHGAPIQILFRFADHCIFGRRRRSSRSRTHSMPITSHTHRTTIWTRTGLSIPQRPAIHVVSRSAHVLRCTEVDPRVSFLRLGSRKYTPEHLWRVLVLVREYSSAISNT